MTRDGRITDAMSVAAILRVALDRATAGDGRPPRRLRRRSSSASGHSGRPRHIGRRPDLGCASWGSSGSSSGTPTAHRPITAGSSASPTTGPTTSGSPSGPSHPGRSSRRRPTSGSSPSPAGSICGRPIPRSRWPTTPTASPPRTSRSSCSMPRRSSSAGPRGDSRTTSIGMYQPQGGIADPYRGNVAHRRLALDQGATAPRRVAGRGNPRGRRRLRGRRRRVARTAPDG